MPESIRLILARHGETEANRNQCFGVSDDVELTGRGRAHAEELAADILQRFHPESVFSSRLTRARQTAEIIADHLGLRAEILEGIHEREFGCLKGQPYERMGTMMLGDPAYDPEHRELWSPDGGESLDQVRRRVIAALQTLASGRIAESVVVSHGAVMECVSAHLEGSWDRARVPDNCALMLVDFQTPK